MKPIETQLEISSHLRMYEHLKDMLLREGLIGEAAEDAEVRRAMAEWLDMVLSHRPSIHRPGSA